ncbi:hypothetical protein M569_15836, partial [Genlisea aurea]
MNYLTQIPKLCKGLAVVLIVGHIFVLYFPAAISYIALIPAKTIPFAWNLITSPYFEQSTEGVVISLIGLLVTGKLLDPIWGSRELLKFIFVVNVLTSLCVFVTAICLYYITSQELYLYMPVSGFHGAISGLIVGIKQILPDKELPLLKIKAKWSPSLAILAYVIVSLFRTTEVAAYVPTFVFGAYTGWIYLRYWQKKPDSNIRGDQSDDFAFSTFFPSFLRGAIDPIASVFERAFCKRSETSDD